MYEESFIDENLIEEEENKSWGDDDSNMTDMILVRDDLEDME